jgi:hypothetical protein
MITISSSAANAAAAATVAAQAADAGVAAAPTDATGGLLGGDPLAQFGATHGLHPQVQKFAFASPNGPSGGTTKGAAAVYEVGATDAATIAKLKSSPDDATRRLGRTIENANIAYGDLIKQGAKVYVTTSAGNGGQPVLTMKAPGFKDSLPAHVHTHYHGDNATVADPIGSKAGTNARMREVMARNSQTVFVLPESTWYGKRPQQTDTPQHDTLYSASWAQVTSQARTTDDALRAAKVSNVGSEVVSVHSKGGSAIAQIMAADPSGNGLRCDRLELHDSLYGSQANVAAWAKTANGKAVKDVVYIHGDNPPGRHRVIEQAFGKRFSMIDILKDAPKLDQTNNPDFKDQGGNTFKRMHDWTDAKGYHQVWVTVGHIDTRAHYRTVGQYLDTPPPAKKP